MLLEITCTYLDSKARGCSLQLAVHMVIFSQSQTYGIDYDPGSSTALKWPLR